MIMTMIMTYDVACPICGRIDRSLYPEKGVTMATSKGYLKYVLEQLSGLPEISHRAMMGEYVLYYRGKVIGGIYENWKWRRGACCENVDLCDTPWGNGTE